MGRQAGERHALHLNALHLMLAGVIFGFFAFLGKLCLPQRSRFHAGVLMRLSRGMVLTMSMGFAWCLFFSTRWFLAGVEGLDNDRVKQQAVPDAELLAVISALILSFGAVVAILAFDKLADADWTPEEVDNAIGQLIAAIGILVGIAWKQCILQSVAAVAAQSSNVQAYKHVLAFMSVALIAPAWKWYLLPMAHNHGWRFGFVPSLTKVSMAEDYIKTKETSTERFVVNGNKSVKVTPTVNRSESSEAEPIDLELEAALEHNESLRRELHRVETAKTNSLKLYNELMETASMSAQSLR